MINKYLLQTAVWKTVTGVDQYNQPAYDTSTINCRKEGTNRLVNNQLGQAVTANTRVYCVEAVKVNDLIDDRQVVAVDEAVYRGKVSHYEVYLQ